MDSQTVEMRFSKGEKVDAASLAEFLYLFNAVYTSCAQVLDEKDLSNRNSSEFIAKASKKISTLNVNDVNKLFSKDLGSKTLVIQGLAYHSPLRVTVSGVLILLAVAVTFSGGTYELGPLKVTLPPIAEGIENLRKALKPAVNAPLSFGIHSRTIKLSKPEIVELLRHDPSQRNKGGFQRFFFSLRYKLHPKTGQIELSDSEIQKIIKNCRTSSIGGWQRSTRKIFGRHFGF